VWTANQDRHQVAAYPGGTATWTYRHDADGQRIRETSPDNVIREYLVDALGRRRAATYTPAAGGEPTSTLWTYDPNGNVRSVEDRFATGDPLRITRTWDRRDRIESETDPHGRTLRYTYDPHGNRLNRIDEAAGETTTYTWDARHRNTSVSSPSSGTTTLTWYRDDRQHTITRPGNGLSTTTWDRAGRVAGIVHAVNGTPLATLAYGYDLNGNRASETLTHAGQPPITSTYTHDEADRLQSMTVDGITTTYTLDGAGNRTGERTAVDGQPATRDRTCTVDARDRVQGCTDAATGVTETYAWDATGRMTQETIGGLTRSHAWDARDRLLRLEEVAGPTTTYAYDPEGLRIETRQGAAGERVQYDAGHRHAETNGAGNVTRTYQATAPHRATSRGSWARAGAAAMTLFLGLTDAGAIPTQRHYLHDAHGTPVAITTHEGALAQRSSYDVWGNPTRVETLDAGLQAKPNRIGFTGYTLDIEGSRSNGGASATSNNPIGSARYYAKARYYGAGRGGFLSVDPWDGDPTSPVSLNKYLYGFANPGVYIDPDGRCPYAAACGFGYGWANARSGEERTAAAINYAGTTPVLGVPVGAGLEAADAVGAVAKATADVYLAIGGDEDAQQRWADRADGLDAYNQRARQAAAQYGPIGPAALVATDFVKGVQSNATDFADAGERGDYLAQGRATLRLTGDAAAVTGVAGAARFAVTRVAVAEGRAASIVVEGDRLDPGVRLNDIDGPPTSALPRRSFALDPSSSPVYSIKEARRLGGESRGAIFVREPQRAGAAADFEAGSPSAFSDVASQKRAVPALRFVNPNSRGNNFVRFDGYEDGGYTLVDRKTQLTTGTKQISDLRRVSEAVAQNDGYRVVYEFPTPQAAAAARRILDAQGIDNISVRVAGQ
jgi:RHS repeat-associated protein